MTNLDDDKLTEEAKQLYRKTRVPHKFCPYCGTKNESDADRCANCGRDISWMRIPEPVPYSEAPKEPPRSLPTQQKVFTPRVVIVIALIVALLFAFVLVIVLVTRGKSAPLHPALMISGFVLLGDRSTKDPAGPSELNAGSGLPGVQMSAEMSPTHVSERDGATSDEGTRDPLLSFR